MEYINKMGHKAYRYSVHENPLTSQNTIQRYNYLRKRNQYTSAQEQKRKFVVDALEVGIMHDIKDIVMCIKCHEVNHYKFIKEEKCHKDLI